jgi:hypothetical protein
MRGNFLKLYFSQAYSIGEVEGETSWSCTSLKRTVSEKLRGNFLELYFSQAHSIGEVS